MVKVTLIEANQILSSFDGKLRSYAERKIKQRSQMHLLSGSVVGMYICVPVLIMGGRKGGAIELQPHPSDFKGTPLQ